MSNCMEPQAHPDRCGCDPADTQQVSSTWLAQLRAEHAQFGAECRRLQEVEKGLRSSLDDALRERDEVAARLKAFEELHSGEYGLPSDGWPVYHKRKMETLRDLIVGRYERKLDKLSTELDAIKAQKPVAWRYLNERARWRYRSAWFNGGDPVYALPVSARLEAIKALEPIKLSEDVREYLQEGINSATQCEDADMDYDFANELSVLLGTIYTAPPSAKGARGLGQNGYDQLWHWFGLSYAAWLTLPRVLMHAMPDDWQRRMAELLFEWNAAWSTGSLPAPEVTAKADGKYTAWPEWVLNYRHPDMAAIEAVRAKQDTGEPW